MPKQHYRPETFRARDSIGYLIKRSHRLMQERIEGLFADQGFTLQQWVVMMHIRDGLALTTADLCRELHHDSGAMTRLIDGAGVVFYVGKNTTDFRWQLRRLIVPKK